MRTSIDTIKKTQFDSEPALYRSYRKEWHRQGDYYYDCHVWIENNTYNYKSANNIPLLPRNAVPTDVMDMEGGWRISFNQPMMKERNKGKTPDSFMTYLMTQE
jgi:hypothetical protein